MQRMFAGKVMWPSFVRSLRWFSMGDPRRQGEGAMDLDDLEPIKKKPPLKNLEVMSIEALGEYIDELKGEIARVEAEIAAKRKARAGAESVFKK
jgi:uncharacterized small protein (DUF1192 family)